MEILVCLSREVYEYISELLELEAVEGHILAEEALDQLDEYEHLT